MKRTWQHPTYPTNDEGSEEAHRLAQTLAGVCDSATMRSFIDAKTAMDRFGGNFFVTAYREKFDAYGNRIPAADTETPGTMQTVGFLCHYEHLNNDVSFQGGLPPLEFADDEIDLDELMGEGTDGADAPEEDAGDAPVQAVDEVPEPVEG